MLIWLWNNKVEILLGSGMALLSALADWIRRRKLATAGTSQHSAMEQHRPRLFVLPTWAGELTHEVTIE